MAQEDAVEAVIDADGSAGMPEEEVDVETETEIETDSGGGAQTSGKEAAS